MVEGAECTGKSTSVENVMDTTNTIHELVLEKAVKGPHMSAEEITRVAVRTIKWLQFAIESDIWYIIDRGFVSSQVYNNVYMRSKVDFISMFTKYKNKHLIIYYHKCNEATAEKRLKSRTHKITTEYNKDWKEIAIEFEKIIKMMKKDGYDIIEADTSD